MPTLLIVSNCPSPNTLRLQQAAADGARFDAGDADVEVRVKQPLQADARDVLAADGIILGTTENFGAMSGLVKDFLERIYYPCLEKTEGLPAAVFIKGGLDGEGAKVGVEKIFTGMRWKLVQPTVVLRGKFEEGFVTKCREIGAYMAAGLDAQIF